MHCIGGLGTRLRHCVANSQEWVEFEWVESEWVEFEWVESVGGVGETEWVESEYAQCVLPGLLGPA